MAKVLTAKEFAQALDTDPRTARKFLRSDAKSRGIDAPGKGSRWVIKASEVRSLKARFAKWDAERAQSPADEVADAEVIDATDDA